MLVNKIIKSFNIIKLLVLFLFSMFILSLMSCEPKKEYRESSTMPLRQLVTNSLISETKSSSWFFLSGSSKTTINEKQFIKMYVLVDGSYKFQKFEIADLRLRIDNSIKTPYLTIGYFSNRLYSDEYLLDSPYISNIKYILHIPEDFLPEYLNQIIIE